MISPSIFFFFFIFFKSSIFGVVNAVKGQKVAQNDKNVSVSICISEAVTHMIVGFDTHAQNISRTSPHSISQEL